MGRGLKSGCLIVESKDDAKSTEDDGVENRRAGDGSRQLIGIKRWHGRRSVRIHRMSMSSVGCARQCNI